MKLDDTSGGTKAKVMRCLGCGAEMILLKVVPDTNMMVAGYEHHTSQCSGCYEVEQRLIFSQRNESQRDENQPAEPATDGRAAAPNPASSEAAGGSPPGEPVANGHAVIPEPKPATSAWKRAVEKVRIQQAGLKERLNGRVRAELKVNHLNRDCENLSSPQGDAGAAKEARSIHLDKESGNDAIPAPAANGDNGPSAAAGGDAAGEKIDLSQGFDRVWEQLVPRLPPGSAGRGAVDAGEGRGQRPPSA